MTLSSRKSRKIIVDGDEYTWSLSQDSGYMILVVQNASGRGKKLEVVISDVNEKTIENGSYTIKNIFERKFAITPGFVQQVIRDALHLGWEPKNTGAPVELSLVAGVLKIRRGL